MGSLFSGLFGGGSSTSAPNNNAGTIGALGQLANTEQGLGNQLTDLGNNVYGPAFNQFSAGASGQLTPAQAALTQENLAATNLSTSGLYGNLGLGGSTMEGQDMNANALRSLSEQAALEAQSESLGLSGLSQAGNYYTGAGTQFANSGTALDNAGRLQTSNQADLNNAISSLGSKAGSSLNSLLGPAAGAGAGSLFGSSAVGAGAADVGTSAAATDAALGSTVDAGAAGGIGGGLGLTAADTTGLGLGAGAAADAGLAATGGSKAASAAPALLLA